MFRALPVTMLLLAAFATVAPLLIFVYLYRDSREPFFRWWIVGWLLYALQWVSDILHVVSGPPIVWLFASHLLAGLSAFGIWLSSRAFRAPVELQPRHALPVLAYVGWMGVVLWRFAEVPLALFSLSALRGVAYLMAAVGFYPRRGEPSVMGARLLSASLFLWGLTRASVPLLQTSGPTSQILFSGMGFVHFLLVVGVVILALDRRRRETQHLQAFTDTILKSMAQGVAIVDRDFSVRYANRWMEERFPRVARGRLCFHVLDSDGSTCRGCPWTGHQGSPGQGFFETDGPGDQRFLVSYSPLRNPDGTTSLLEVVTDISELHRLRTRLSQSERLAMLGEIATGVTHELRNPLSAIANAVHVLGSGELGSAEARRMSEIVKLETQRLNTILTDFLRYAKPPQPRRLQQDANQLLAEVARLLRQDSRTPPSTKIREELDPRGARGVFDPDQLRQVIWNIAINGIEAMPGGGELRFASSADERGLRISIHNTGPAIPEGERSKIFEPFYSRKPGGTGLGLAIVEQIMRAHGGHVTVDCPEGGGVEFTIHLPAPDAAPPDESR
jgi:signal transduction histidine kinase